MQLEFAWFPSGCVRSVVRAYYEMVAPTVAESTAQSDYIHRARWLEDELGGLTPAASVTYATLESAARRARSVLDDPTIVRRIQFWRRAVDYGRMREVVPEGPPVRIPPWLDKKCRPSGDYYTLEQYREFRLALPPGRFRDCEDLSFWSGMHTIDVFGTKRWMLEPDYQWPDSDCRGRWWRRNTKSGTRRRRPTKITPCWVPMEPELRELALEWLSRRESPEACITGRVWNLKRACDSAAARAGLPHVRANLGMRSSHANLLLARDYSQSYVQIVLGHVGPVHAEVIDGAVRARTVSPTVLTANYMRQSPDILRPR